MRKRNKFLKYQKKIRNFRLKIKNKSIIKIFLKKYIIFIVMVLLSGFIMTKYTILNQKYYIKQITFEKKTIEKYYNQDLYNQIIQNLSGKNIYISKIKKNALLSQIQQNYPIVKNINIFWQAPLQKAIVKIDFYYPNIIFKTQDGFILGSKNNILFPLNTKSPLITGLTIYLPEYLSGESYFSGFYFKIKENILKYQFEQIKTYFKDQIDKIIYLPGGGKTIVILKSGIEIYFDNQKDILIQLSKLNQNKQLLTDPNVLKIDLGSLKDYIFVTKKQ